MPDGSHQPEMGRPGGSRQALEQQSPAILCPPAMVARWAASQLRPSSC